MKYLVWCDFGAKIKKTEKTKFIFKIYPELLVFIDE